MLRVGISGKVVKATIKGNFQHLSPDDDDARLNLFEMDTVRNGSVGGDSAAGAIEHFRSTGIRDVVPDEGRYEKFESFQRPGTLDFTQIEVSRAIAAFDVDPGHRNIYGLSLSSNDVNADHPARAQRGCGPADSLDMARLSDGHPDQTHKCFSNLHGSITFMFQELGTPTGPHAVLSSAEMRALFLQSELPSGFEARNPSACVGGAFGCDSCWADYAEEEEAATRETLRHRYCRCMLANDFELSGGFEAAGDIALPGELQDPLYRTTCKDSWANDEADRGDAAPAVSNCAPFCFAGGSAAAGSFGDAGYDPNAHE